ncbi:MAG TPA: aminoglycoside resistance protein [Rhodospirillaceae bacterium]|jgi:aminoglycoside phosphotransferase (APT) family kinase protein|nr:aminoglycoside phosphotransferase family protein [Alphaproteobacteria bacterium]HBH26807.1 aminoglycoside resistance protein [Rhodospirillaceae bacterium]
MPFVPDHAALTPAFLGREVAPYVPGLDAASARALPTGDASYAVDFGAVIVRLPRDAGALEALRREAAVCTALPAFPDLATPHPVVVEAGAYPFAWHRKIPGEHLTPEVYGALSETQKDSMAATLVQFFAALHAATPRLGPLGSAEPWPWYLSPEALHAAAPGVIPPDLAAHFAQAMAAYESLEVAPKDMVFGYFDAHGQNMAFDAGAGRLVGLYDFADCGTGDRHADFHPLNTISPDLTSRVVEHYTALTGIPVDLRRVHFYTTVCNYNALLEVATGRWSLVGDTVESLLHQIRHWAALGLWP